MGFSHIQQIYFICNLKVRFWFRRFCVNNGNCIFFSLCCHSSCSGRENRERFKLTHVHFESSGSKVDHIWLHIHSDMHTHIHTCIHHAGEVLWGCLHRQWKSRKNALLSLHFWPASCHLFYCRTVSPALFTYCIANCIQWGSVGFCACACVLESERSRCWGFFFFFFCFSPHTFDLGLVGNSIMQGPKLDLCAFIRWTQSPACWEEQWWLGHLSRQSALHLEEDYKVKHQDCSMQSNNLSYKYKGFKNIDSFLYLTSCWSCECLCCEECLC